MRRALFRFACILLLLFAQQGALTHAAWHANASSPVQNDTHGKASFHGGLCDLHHAFGQVLGGVHTAASLCPTRTTAADLVKPHSFSAGILSFLAPLSRGPPSSS